MLQKRQAEGGGGTKPKQARIGPPPARTTSVPSSTRSKNGRIKVYVRLRPFKQNEHPDRMVVQASDGESPITTLVFDPKKQEDDFYFRGEVQRMRDMNKKVQKNQTFEFDEVFPPGSTNQQVFDSTTSSIVSSVFEGFNCSVFAYGATGAGKTYTMLGKEDNPGISYLTIKELLKNIDLNKDKLNVSISCSYIEVYNEEIRDLLSPGGKKLELREDRGTTVISGLRLVPITDTRQLYTLLESGNKIRTQHPTDSNAESSRSHAVFQVRVRMQEKCAGGQTKVAKLTMIDLAGSERGCATGYKGKQFKEGRAINQSLLALGNCINALADGQKYIPYRDSKLTRILKDSLGGNCQTIMIANVSPSDLSYDETYNTLKYATRARSILTSASQNLIHTNLSVAQYRLMVDQMKITLTKSENDLNEAEKWTNEMDAVMSEKIKIFSSAMKLESQKKIEEYRLNEAEVLQRLHQNGVPERLVSSMDQWRRSIEVFNNRIKEFEPRIQEIKSEEAKLVNKMKQVLPHISKHAQHIYNRVSLAWQKELEAALSQVDNHHKDSLFRLMSKKDETLSYCRDKTVPLVNNYFELLKAYGHVTSAMTADHNAIMREVQGKKYVSFEDLNEERESNTPSYFSTLSIPGSLAQAPRTDVIIRDVVAATGGLARLRHTTPQRKTPLRSIQPLSKPITRLSTSLGNKSFTKSPKLQEIIASINKENISLAKDPLSKIFTADTRSKAKKKLGFKSNSVINLKNIA